MEKGPNPERGDEKRYSGGAVEGLTPPPMHFQPPDSGGNPVCPSLAGIPFFAKIGQGGMGAVYYGFNTRLESEVAVKVLPFHLAAQDPSLIQRFFREARIAAKVASPHLVRVIDVNEEAG